MVTSTALRRATTSVGTSKSDRWLVMILIVVGTAVYLPKLTSTVLIEHDDVISVIGATCNQGRFERWIPTGQWVDASMWQQYWQWFGGGCFDQISVDLAHYDIHPPLYFWLLHSWFGVFGVSLTAGLMLNLVFVAVSVAAVYATCRALAVSSIVSFMASLAWMLSLPTRTAVSLVRQYTLLAMLTALLLLLVVLWLQKRHRGYIIGIGVVLAAGLLTHYQFGVPAAVVLLFAIAIVIRRGEHPAVAQLIGAGVAAFLVAGLLHPGVLASVSRADAQTQPFTVAGFGQRVASVVSTVSQIFNPLDWSHPLPYGLFDMHQPLYAALNMLNVLVGLGAVCIVVRLVVRAFRKRPRPAPTMVTVEYLPAFAAVTSWCLIVAMYVACISPVHAIGLQYLLFLTPFLFVAVAQLAQAHKDVLPHSISVSIVPVLLVGALIGTSVFVWHRAERAPILALGDADTVIIDSTRIGVLPAVLWHANPDTKVYALPQEDLVAGFPNLATAGDRLAYVAASSYGNAAEHRAEIEDRLSKAGYRNETRVTGGVPLIPLGGEILFFTR